MKNVTTSNKFLILVVADLISGAGIAWLDNSPGWDDTAITAGFLFTVSFLSGFIYRKKLWLWALLTGIWIPLFGIIKTGNYSILLVLVISFAGSFAGGLAGRAFRKS